MIFTTLQLMSLLYEGNCLSDAINMRLVDLRFCSATGPRKTTTLPNDSHLLSPSNVYASEDYSQAHTVYELKKYFIQTCVNIKFLSSILSFFFFFSPNILFSNGYVHVSAIPDECNFVIVTMGRSSSIRTTKGEIFQGRYKIELVKETLKTATIRTAFMGITIHA